MRDLTAQLARYGEYLLETTPAATFEPDPVRVIPAAGSEPPLKRRIPSWAIAAIAAVIAVAVGAAGILLLGNPESGTAPVVDEGPTEPTSTPSTVAPAPETTVPPTTLAQVRFRVDELDGEWWPGSDVAALPGGGFVVVTDGMGVFWTRDGEVWTDADPGRMVSAHFQFSDYHDLSGSYEQPQRLTVVGDRIAVLDREAAQVWIGHLTDGEWESIPLGNAVESASKMAITANEDLVFVVSGGGVYWVIDLEKGNVRQGSLPQGVHYGGLTAAWFNDRWVVALGPPGSSLVSRDTVEWQRGTLYALPGDPLGITSLAVGNDTIIAAGCRGLGPHPVVYSNDGIVWQWAPRFLGEATPSAEDPSRRSGFWNTLHAGAAYSDALGFVTVLDGGTFDSGNYFLATSRDGQAWAIADVTLPGGYGEIVNIAASADQVLLTVIDWSGQPSGEALLLTVESDEPDRPPS